MLIVSISSTGEFEVAKIRPGGHVNSKTKRAAFNLDPIQMGLEYTEASSGAKKLAGDTIKASVWEFLGSQGRSQNTDGEWKALLSQTFIALNGKYPEWIGPHFRGIKFKLKMNRSFKCTYYRKRTLGCQLSQGLVERFNDPNWFVLCFDRMIKALRRRGRLMRISLLTKWNNLCSQVRKREMH